MPLGTSTATVMPAPSAGCPGERGGVVAQAAATADAEHPVEHEVGPADERRHPRLAGGQRTTAGPAERGEARRVRPVGGEQDGGDAGAAAGQARAGEQRVAAVVAAAHEQHDAAAVDRARAAGTQTVASPAAARCISVPSGVAASSGSSAARTSSAVYSPIIRRPRAATPSATTIAEAIPPSWLSDRCQVLTPSWAARPATLPRTSRCGRPWSPTTTSASCQCRSPGAPRALASASLAANRAASDSPLRGAPEGVCCSAAVNSRSRRPGVRVERRGEPLDRHDVDPDPDDHPVSLPRPRQSPSARVGAGLATRR